MGQTVSLHTVHYIFEVSEMLLLVGGGKGTFIIVTCRKGCGMHSPFLSYCCSPLMSICYVLEHRPH